ncbi:MAG TPA: hypothetical protein VJI46_05875 [Candidatus Nanoarchaeia archaeon]|nr:hypothetical protein [Candidatus Nanoarchaeia archaeon]
MVLAQHENIRGALSLLERELKNVGGIFFKGRKRAAKFIELREILLPYSPAEIIGALRPLIDTKYSLVIEMIQRTRYLWGTCSECHIGDVVEKEYEHINDKGYTIEKSCSAVCGYRQEIKIG